MPEQRQTKSADAIYRGRIAVEKRLRSAGLQVSRISLYRGKLGSVWEADTDRGKRWVSYSAGSGWKSMREPPGKSSGDDQ